MTYSIVAKDPETGSIGIAVASRFFACGSLVPFVAPDVAVASQAYCNPLWGVEGLQRMRAGEAADGVLKDFLARDGGQSIRQAHMIDQTGQIAAHTGADCVDWAGHNSAENVSVAGNMLTGPSVVADTLTAYRDNMDQPFLERLMRAMEAGESAGGDKRGRQAAGIIIHRGEAYPWLDIRADDHSDPLAELRRLIDVSQERYVHFAMGLAKADNFSGVTDRTPIDTATREAENERKALGIASRSFATDACLRDS